MCTQVLRIGLFLSALLFISYGQAKDIQAVVQLAGGNSVQVVDDWNKTLNLVAGPISYRLERPGLALSSMFSGARQLVLTQNRQSIYFSLNASDLKPDGSFDSTSHRGTKFSVKSEVAEVLGSPRQAKGFTNCVYSGFCTACTPALDAKGGMTMDCGYKFYAACTGLQSTLDELVEKTSTRKIIIIDQTSGTTVAEIISEPVTQTEKKILQVTGMCQ